MAALIAGTDIKVVNGTKIDSIIPPTRTTSKTLVAGVDQIIQADPTAGEITFTLPDAVSNPGVRFFVKRIINGNNNVNIETSGSDTLEGTSNGYSLALLDEHLGIYSDGTASWRIYTKDIFSICTMSATAASFTVTDSPTKFTSWDTVVFSTPGKLVGNLTTDVIDILEFQGPVADGYTVNVLFSFGFTNNNTVTFQLMINGALAGTPISVNANGSSKPVSVAIIEQLAVTVATTLELHITAENGGSITGINASMQIQRIGR